MDPWGESVPLRDKQHINKIHFLTHFLSLSLSLRRIQALTAWFKHRCIGLSLHALGHSQRDRPVGWEQIFKSPWQPADQLNKQKQVVRQEQTNIGFLLVTMTTSYHDNRLHVLVLWATIAPCCVLLLPRLLDDLPKRSDGIVVAHVLEADAVHLQQHVSRFDATVGRHSTATRGRRKDRHTHTPSQTCSNTTQH